MKSARYIAIVVVLACVSGAFAQRATETVREGVWNSSLAAAQRVSRYTGRPVMILFAEDWCGHCENLEVLLAHRDLRDIMKRFILVKLEPDMHRVTVEKYNVTAHHQIVMLDWSGRVAGSIREELPAKDVALRIVAAAAQNDLLAGDKLFALGYYAKAAERYRDVIKSARDPKTQTRAQRRLANIRDLAKRQLEQVKTLIGKNRPEEALDLCRRMAADFPPDIGGDEARKILGRLLSGKPIDFSGGKTKPASGASRAAKENAARKMLDAGMVYEWDKRFYDAVTIYRRIDSQYPDAKSAGEARKRIEQLLADEKMKKLIDQQKRDRYCRRRLEMAELYEQNGLTAMAVKYYQDVIAAYPDSAYADEARRHVKGILKQGKKAD